MWYADILRAHLCVRACWLILYQTDQSCASGMLCLPSEGDSPSQSFPWWPRSPPRGARTAGPHCIPSRLEEGSPPTGWMETSQLPLRGLPASFQMKILESCYQNKRSNTVIKLSLMTWILHAIYLRSSEMNHAPRSLSVFLPYFHLPTPHQAPRQGHQLLLPFLSDVEATETIFLFHVVQ